MALEINDLARGRHKHMAELNQLMGSHPPPSDLRQVGGFLRALNDHYTSEAVT